MSLHVMTLFEKSAKKYHKSIIEVSFKHGIYRNITLQCTQTYKKTSIFRCLHSLNSMSTPTKHTNTLPLWVCKYRLRAFCQGSKLLAYIALSPPFRILLACPDSWVCCKKPCGQSVNKPWATSDQALGNGCPGCGQQVNKPWAMSAQAVGNECPKNGTELGQYAAWTKKIGLAWYASAIFVEKWHFYDTSMTLLWYFSAQKARSVIACMLLSIIVLHCSILQSMILWHFFSKKHFTCEIRKEVIAHIIG